MHILQLGFNYKTMPIHIREKFVFNDEINDALIELKKQKSILENVILSTCNRTEIFVVVDQLHTGRYYVKQFLADWFDLEISSFEDYLIINENDYAIEHIFSVTSGLKSMILGETQILGQVRDAFLLAQKLKTTGTIFNELFKRAITFSKRSHRETAIGENAVSISYAAVQLAKSIFTNLNDKHIVIYGAGEMAELAVKNLHGSGVNEITVVNRTFERAEALAKKFRAEAFHESDLPQVLERADILISSTGAQELVIEKEKLESVMEKREKQPLFLVDIAVPRDISDNVSELKNVHLYDIDDLQDIVDESLTERKKAAEEIEGRITYELEAFKIWIHNLGVVPVIHGLREHALEIQSETYESILRKIPDLTEREKKVISKHTKSIVNQLLKEPIIQSKEMAGRKNSDELLALVIDVFGLDDTLKTEVVDRIKRTKALSPLKQPKEISYPPIKNVY